MAEKFNPEKHLIQLKGKDYLQVQHRVLWFRAEHPKGRILTEVINIDPLIYKATITDNDGNILATGHGSAQPKAGSVWSGRETEKAETAAVGRALGLAGYGTQFTSDFSDGEDDYLADSPQAPKSSQNSPSKPTASAKGKSTPKPPEQAADAEIWPSDTSVGELLKRITAKDGLAPNAPLPDIARWAGIDDVLNIEAWAKYPTRAVAGYAIKVAYEQEWKKSDSEWRANMEEPIHDVPF